MSSVTGTLNVAWITRRTSYMVMWLGTCPEVKRAAFSSISRTTCDAYACSHSRVRLALTENLQVGMVVEQAECKARRPSP